MTFCMYDVEFELGKSMLSTIRRTFTSCLLFTNFDSTALNKRSNAVPCIFWFNFVRFSSVQFITLLKQNVLRGNNAPSTSLT